MRTYGKVKIAFWEDDKIAGLNDEAKLLALYCLTGEHSNAIGCFRLPIGYIETDLRWDKAKAERALTCLTESGFALYDEDSHYLLMPRYLEHNPIENSRVGKMCVQLINAAMRSRKVFPDLWQALQPQKHRFVLKEADFWNSEWDTLYHTVSGGSASPPSHTVSDTVSNRVSDTVSDTQDPQTALPLESGSAPHYDTVSQTVPDTASDTISSTLHDFAPPEPEPQPDPYPRDDEVTRAKITPVAIIHLFDDAIVQVYGANLARPWPHGEDAIIAAQFIAAGATLDLCKQVFLRHLYAQQRKGKHPIGSLAYFRTAIPDALKEQEYYQNNPPQEVSHDRNTHGASRQSGARRSGHDAFTDALVEVVHERGGH